MKCIAKNHNETNCLIKWGVSHKKYNPGKWCQECLEKYENTFLVIDYQKNKASENESKKRKHNA